MATEIGPLSVRSGIWTDADLASARGQAVRPLLYLFEWDAAVRTTRSG